MSAMSELHDQLYQTVRSVASRFRTGQALEDLTEVMVAELAVMLAQQPVQPLTRLKWAGKFTAGWQWPQRVADAMEVEKVEQGIEFDVVRPASDAEAHLREFEASITRDEAEEDALSLLFKGALYRPHDTARRLEAMADANPDNPLQLYGQHFDVTVRKHCRDMPCGLAWALVRAARDYYLAAANR